MLHEGTDIAIISNGILTYEALKAAQMLEKEGIHARVINMGTIKPIDADIVVAAAKECGKIITAEEHSVIGGLGEAVCACLAERYPAPVVLQRDIPPLSAASASRTSSASPAPWLSSWWPSASMMKISSGLRKSSWRNKVSITLKEIFKTDT